MLNSYPIHDRSVAVTGIMDVKSVWTNYYSNSPSQQKDYYLYTEYFNNWSAGKDPYRVILYYFTAFYTVMLWEQKSTVDISMGSVTGNQTYTYYIFQNVKLTYQLWSIS